MHTKSKYIDIVYSDKCQGKERANALNGKQNVYFSFSNLFTVSCKTSISRDKAMFSLDKLFTLLYSHS